MCVQGNIRVRMCNNIIFCNILLWIIIIKIKFKMKLKVYEFAIHDTVMSVSYINYETVEVVSRIER